MRYPRIPVPQDDQFADEAFERKLKAKAKKESDKRQTQRDQNRRRKTERDYE